MNKKRGKGIIVITMGIIVLISILGGYIVLSEDSPFALKHNLSVTVKDAQGVVMGATVDINGVGIYTTDSSGSIESLSLSKGTYFIVVTSPEYGTKTETIDLVSDMNLIIEIDYTHQYLTITSPVNGATISPDDAEKDPSGTADIIIWVQGIHTPGREVGNYIKTFIDEDSRHTLTSVSAMWDAKVFVGHISAGSHTLYVQYLSGSNVIEQQSIFILIPTEWHISFSTVGLADSGEGITRGASWLGMNPPFPGQIIRVTGRFYLDSLGNTPWTVWLNVHEPSNNWHIAEGIIEDTVHGWNNFDVGIDYIPTDWWTLNGAVYESGEVYNRVTEFEGEIWMVAGTHYYHTSSINILDWLNDQFFPGEDEIKDGGTSPCVSDDGGILMSIDPTDLYAYTGSTPMAWFICIVISLIVILGVAIFFMRRRGMV